MEARENPLHQHWGTRFKSIDEVSKEMIECKEEVDRAWKLKREEKNWWRKGSNEKEVGWCLAHEDFCDMDSRYLHCKLQAQERSRLVPSTWGLLWHGQYLHCKLQAQANIVC